MIEWHDDFEISYQYSYQTEKRVGGAINSSGVIQSAYKQVFLANALGDESEFYRQWEEKEKLKQEDKEKKAKSL